MAPRGPDHLARYPHGANALRLAPYRAASVDGAVREQKLCAVVSLPSSAGIYRVHARLTLGERVQIGYFVDCCKSGRGNYCFVAPSAPERQERQMP
jgi:hypothetical protein